MAIPGGGAGAAPKASGTPGKALVGAITSQLLGIASDDSTHVTGHAATFTSHAADRSAAKGRFAGYESDARTSAKNAAKAVLGRGKGIRKQYNNAGKAATGAANREVKSLQSGARAAANGYAQSAAEMGLQYAPPSDSRTQLMSNLLQGRSAAVGQNWAGFDRSQGLRAAERNSTAADSILYTGRQQETALNGLLENVLSGLQDTSTPSTLGTAANTSTSTKMTALQRLAYLQKDQDQNSLAQQKLLNSTMPQTSTTTQTGANGQVLSRSRTTRG